MGDRSHFPLVETTRGDTVESIHYGSDGDPSRRVSSIVSLALLKKLGVFSDQELTELKEYYIRPINNWRSTAIGEIRPTAEFLQALDNISL